MPRPSLHKTDFAQRVVMLGTLYFVQGVPFGLFIQALPVILREQGTSFEGIGLSSLLAIPWALKFLWAPWVDRKPFWGPRRKGWILALHATTMIALTVLAFFDPAEHLPVLLGGILFVNFLNATQDIATDGLAVDLLPVRERGIGNALQVGGYRIGMVFGGAGALLLVDGFGWKFGILGCVGALAVSIIPLIHAVEPGASDSKWQRTSVREFLKRVPAAWSIIALLFAFKFGDAMAMGMVRPMLVDMGFSMADVAIAMGVYGFLFGLLGALVGGLSASLFGRFYALVGAVVFQIAGAALYLFLLFEPPTFQEVAWVVGIENLLGGIATVIMFTCMMDWARPKHSGADYTVMASAIVLATGIGSVASGFSVGQFGFVGHFVVSIVATAVGGGFACVLYRSISRVTDAAK